MAYTTIKKPSDYFNTVLITGDANDPRAVTGYGFAPDLIFAKQRSGNANGGFFDKVRGATKFLYSNQNDAEGTTANTPTSFDSDGFTIGDDNSNFYYNGTTFAYWGWRADGTSGSSNTDGSITSTVSANTTSGFSIVSYTGTGANATIGHGLGSTPKIVFIKNRTDAVDWSVNNQVLCADIGDYSRYLVLNANSTVSGAGNVRFQNTPFTSSVFNVGTDNSTNGSGDGMIAYCFAEVKGYSKFGIYSGNGNADGTFVYTDFKPAFIMIKDADNLEQWFIFDSKRNPSNVSKNLLYASDSSLETTSGANQIDILSNGFKMRSTNNGTNRSGGEGFTYMAFAEEPLVGDNPATAR